MLKTDEEEIKTLVTQYFELGKTKDLEGIDKFLASSFHKFGESPPYDRRRLDRALTLEQMFFANISDFEFKIEDLSIELYGDIALATFALELSGIVVDDYSFRGAAVRNRLRATFVFRRTGNGWKIIHQHMSRFQD